MAFPISKPLTATAVSALLGLGTLGCTDYEEALRALESENVRLSEELGQTREELQALRLQLRQEQLTERRAADEFAETPTNSELLRSIGERDLEIDYLREQLAITEEKAARYRKAGERAVERLNQETRNRSRSPDRP